MQKAPLVSVIVPSYNKPEYLPECLRSIQAQTFRDWECIVVSDGSPRVEEIRAAVRAMGDNRFRLVEHEVNRGPAAARNTGVKFAKADLFLWVDEDDALDPDCLSLLLRHWRQTRADIIRPQQRNMGEPCVRRRIDPPNFPEALVRHSMHSVGFLFHRNVILTAGWLDEAEVLKNGLEDLEWWVRVFGTKATIKVIDDVLYYHRPPITPRHREQSQHHRGMKNAVKIGEYIVKKHAAIYRRYPKHKKGFLARCYQLQLLSAVDRGEFLEASSLAIHRCVLAPDAGNVRTAFYLLLRLLLGSKMYEKMLSVRRMLSFHRRKSLQDGE